MIPLNVARADSFPTIRYSTIFSLLVLFSAEIASSSPTEFSEISTGLLPAEDSAKLIAPINFYSSREISGLQFDVLFNPDHSTPDITKPTGSGLSIDCEAIEPGRLRVLAFCSDGTFLPNQEIGRLGFSIQSEDSSPAPLTISNIIATDRFGVAEVTFLTPFVSIASHKAGNQALVGTSEQISIIAQATTGVIESTSITTEGRTIRPISGTLCSFNWNPARPGTASIVAFATDSSGRTGRSPALKITVPGESFNDFAAFMRGYFPDSWESHLWDDDEDKDGVVNYMEFVLGGDPSVADYSVIAPSLIHLEQDGERYLALEAIVRRDHATDARMFGKLGNGLSFEEAGEATMEITDDNEGDYVHCLIYDPEPVGSHPNRFLRLIVNPDLPTSE